MSDTRLLIVHPEPSASALMASMLQSLGHRIEVTTSDRAAMKLLEQGRADLVLVGVDPCDADALELLQYLRRKYPRTPVILLFTAPHPDRLREAQQRGATAILRFPMAANHLRAAVAQALGRPELGLVAASYNGRPATNGAPTPNDNGAIGRPVGRPVGHADGAATADGVEPQGAEERVFVGDDPCFRLAIELAETIAPTRATVLILGERGTGKSLVARTLHRQSPRRSGPFLEVSCAGLREGALEVELFGRRGESAAAPTGKVAQARGGTLFLDEVSALGPDLQFKLLRVVQDGQYEPVGSTLTVRADTRFVFGSRDDLAELVAQGMFRQDLYYRVGVATLKLPPLRHRGSDVERLAEHFRARFVREAGTPAGAFTPEALDRLKSHNWPGNVDELEAAIQRAVLLARGGPVGAELIHLGTTPAGSSTTAADRPTRRNANASPGIRPLKEALEEPEKRIILQALEALNWNRQETARVLDINRTTLYKKMKKYGLLFDEPVWVN